MDWSDRLAFLENVHLSAVRVPCGGSMGTPRGANRFVLRENPGRSLESAHQVAEAAGACLFCQRRCQRFGGRIHRNRSERTLPKSLTTRARVAALRLIGQPASRGSPRGRTHQGPKTPVPGRPGPSRFRLDPPGSGMISQTFVGPAMRAFRVAEAALGRATLVGLTLCLRLPADAGSLSEFLSDRRAA